MKPITIIMPCYNAEHIIDRTIASLEAQTLGMGNMELIFVDDASTDGTLDKLCVWEKKYPNSVLVVHCDENGRQGRARNIGLAYASGEYIGFMDNDDMVRADMYERMLRRAKQYDADLVIGGSDTITLEEFNKIKFQTIESEKVTVFDIQTVENRKSFLHQDYNIAIWNKIYRRDMILNNHLNFLEGMIYDDIYFSGLMKHCPNRVVVMQDKFYYHIITGENASYGNKDKNLVFGYIEAQLELINELKNRGQYEEFANFYRDEFVVSYAAFIHTYCIQFGYIEIPIWNSLRKTIFQLIPDILENVNIQNGSTKKSTEIILESIRKPVDEKYILKLVSAMMEEKIGR